MSDNSITLELSPQELGIIVDWYNLSRRQSDSHIGSKAYADAEHRLGMALLEAEAKMFRAICGPPEAQHTGESINE